MNIEIWSIGSKNDSFIEEGMQFYFKRIKPYCATSLVIIPPPKRSGNTTPEQSMLEEEKLILSKLTPQHYLIAMDERGKMLTSPQWAQEIQNVMNAGPKTLVFLIGGPWGISEAVKKRANKLWSLSHLVFPHQLVRLIMAEQLYRSFSILNNSPYHHE
jgi:23S rRNA (pseudouridine1915-N3)-methyltransferase